MNMRLMNQLIKKEAVSCILCARYFRSIAGDIKSKMDPSGKLGPIEVNKSYEEAIAALNGLQSNSAVIELARKERSKNAFKTIIHTKELLECLQISKSDLKSLNIVHVAGTKGKGSTCAFVESILRHSERKTGLFTSPHLIAVRERIKLGGASLTKSQFASYFWKVYNCLKSCSNDTLGMPPYFMFLTVMSLYIFVHEKVDVAVLEVGIGGEYDCTNVIEPTVVGVSTLGIDHIHILGDTIKKIAWQKGGIFKPNACAYTSPQEEEAMEVLCRRAKEKDCPLFICPPLSSYQMNGSSKIRLGIAGEVQKLNASLALQLSRQWLNQTTVHAETDPTGKPPIAKPFVLTQNYLSGLENCEWLGRFQVLKKDKITFFMDGAHTVESIETCKKWFQETSASLANEKLDVCKVLIFNCTGGRDPKTLLKPLHDLKFDIALFTPNFISWNKDLGSDQSNFTVDLEKELELVSLNHSIWEQLEDGVDKKMSSSFKFNCLKSAYEWILEKDDQLNRSSSQSTMITYAQDIHVLVTGSLHLVGAILSQLTPQH